jgi:hypothetical protein
VNTDKENGIAWTAIDLSNVSTEFINDMLGRKGGPPEARTALIQELTDRKENE